VDRAVSRLENGFEIAVAVLQQVGTKQETIVIRTSPGGRVGAAATTMSMRLSSAS
jgi:hypothetical protein